MAKLSVDKDRFYSELISLIERSNESVFFYSISCCFGFYTEGLETYANVLHAIRNALHRNVDVRVLAKVDYGNPIDVYAARHFVRVEETLQGPPRQRGSIFRELKGEAERIQYLIADRRSLLLATKQDDTIDPYLDIVINKGAGGNLFEASDNPAEFRTYNPEAFLAKWAESTPLRVNPRPVTQTLLRSYLLRWTAMPHVRDEREVGQLLLGYFRELFTPTLVTAVQLQDADRIDLLINNRRRQERYGIEIKLRADEQYANEIVKKLQGLQQEYDGGFELLVLYPQYSAQTGERLKALLNERDIGLIERN
jgi:hypothetical protein